MGEPCYYCKGTRYLMRTLKGDKSCIKCPICDGSTEALVHQREREIKEWAKHDPAYLAEWLEGK